MKRVLTVFLAALMLLSLCVSAMAEDEIKIVMIGQQLGNVVFLDAEKGMNAAGEDLGVSVEWQSPLRAEAELQNEIMLNLISRGDVDGISISCTTGDALMASREIRDKYIASSLLWDLGVLDEYADALVAELA